MVAQGVPSKHSKELADAVYDDFKRKAIDAAKKRAVAQNVDYDTFKNMVSVAHLRPVTAANIRVAGASAPAWSFTADGQRVELSQAAALAASAALLSDTLPSSPPTTSSDFARDWRRCCPTPDHKFRYLQLCGPQGLRNIFKVEVSTEVLKSILEVLHCCWLGHAGLSEDCEATNQEPDQEMKEEEQLQSSWLGTALWTAQVLEALSSAGRFKLALQLIGPSSKQVVALIVTQLQEALHAAEGCSLSSNPEEDVSGQVQDDSTVNKGKQTAFQPNDKTPQNNTTYVWRDLEKNLRDTLTRVIAAYGLPSNTV